MLIEGHHDVKRRIEAAQDLLGGGRQTTGIRLNPFAGLGQNVLLGWMLAENPHDAHRLDCYLWHAQGGASACIEGDAHPVPAERISFLGCPDCGE
jgi:hypothetical protein